MPSRPLLLSSSLLLSLLAGCGVQRTMVINSNPPGALVYLNHQEVGRTPLNHEFTWYGQYDVTLRKEGYQTLDTSEWVVAPWWQWPPMDFVAELVPGHPHDKHNLTYVLRPATQPADPQVMLQRAAALRGELRSSQFTRAASTQPTTQLVPTTQPARK